MLCWILNTRGCIISVVDEFVRFLVFACIVEKKGNILCWTLNSRESVSFFVFACSSKERNNKVLVNSVFSRALS